MSQTPPGEPDTWATRPMNGPAPTVRLVDGDFGLPEQLGPYRLIRQLGSGGMGVVFLADDTHLGRPAAVKVMKPEVSTLDPRAYDRFLREARVAASVRHPHVVTVYQVGEENGVPYLAMELLRGTSLSDYLDRGDSPGIGSVVRVGREVAEGLAAAHARGLVHRDIKPGNIWLEAPHGRVKLLDFGLARPAEVAPGPDRLTCTGLVVGTPAFMSPEQARGEPVDGRTDLFSLGAVLYLLCTGREPFAGPSPTAVLTALAVDTPRPAHELNPKVPAELSALIDRLLAKKPADRPPSAKDVGKALRQIERGQPTMFAAAPPTPLPTQVAEAPTLAAGPPTQPAAEPGRKTAGPKPARRTGARKRRRRPVRAGWVIAVFACLVPVLIGGTWLVAREDRTPDVTPPPAKAPVSKPAETKPAETKPVEEPGAVDPAGGLPKGFPPPKKGFGPPPGFGPGSPGFGPPPKKGFMKD